MSGIIIALLGLAFIVTVSTLALREDSKRVQTLAARRQESIHPNNCPTTAEDLQPSSNKGCAGPQHILKANVFGIFMHIVTTIYVLKIFFHWISPEENTWGIRHEMDLLSAILCQLIALNCRNISTRESGAVSQQRSDSATLKTCPFCAEQIQTAAVVCRFCGKPLPMPQENRAPQGT